LIFTGVSRLETNTGSKQGAQMAQLGREANDQANDQTAVQIGGDARADDLPGLITLREMAHRPGDSERWLCTARR
jgi:hypothetical protein